MDIKNIPIVLKLDFTQGKDYNVTQVDNWFNNTTNLGDSDTNLKKNSQYVSIF
jgi:hypothetical protein